MFNKIKNVIRNIKSLSALEDMTGTWGLFDSKSNTPNFKRDNVNAILKRLAGYQYFAGDVVAKTVAKQKLRLYAKVPTSRSKFTGNSKTIHVKNIPVPKQRLEYFKGNGEISHNDLMYKTLGAEKGIVEVLDHPVLDLLRFQNPYSNCWQFFYTLALSEMFYGNSYFQKVRDTAGNVVELWLVPAQHMQIIQGKTLDNFIDHYKWGEAIGNEQNFDPNDILDFRIQGVGNSQVYGVSRIETSWDYINLLESSLTFKQALNKNMGRPDFIISSAALAKTNAADLARLERKWEDQHMGEAQAGKMAMTPAPINVHELTRTEIDYNGDESLIKAIATAFGVPEYMMLGSSNIKANSSQQEHDYKEYTIDSYLTMIENILNENLLSEYNDSKNGFSASQDMFFAFDPILEEDVEIIEKRIISKANNGLITANNAALQLGEPEEDGGDVLRFRGRSYESLDKQGSTNTTPTPNEDKEILIPAEKNIDIKDDEMSELLKQIDDVIDDIDNEKKPDSPQIVFNFGSEVVVEEKTVVEDSEKREVVENVEVIDTGIDYKVNDEELEYFSKKGIDKEIENIEVIEESLSDKLAKRIKE